MKMTIFFKKVWLSNTKSKVKNIRNWIKQIEANAQTSVCKVLVGNKYDKSDRVVTEEEGR